jgi:signal transduction histidine kinase
MAVEMLDELGVAVQETIKELRELAHGIYPPLLVDSGLGEALRAVANRSPLDVELITEGIGRYGGDVEAAVYFCCLEALQNAGKHAASAHVVVRVWEESGSLLFEVRDDGPGFDIEPRQARSRLRQHDGPSRRHRGRRSLGVRDRPRHRDPRIAAGRLRSAVANAFSSR